MSDIDIRVKRSLRALTDSSKPRCTRIINALKAFHGLNLGSVSKDTRALIESSLVEFNMIIENYGIQTYEDYKKISSEDLDILIKNQMKLCNEIVALTNA